MAAGMPVGLQEQLRGLVQRQVLLDLYERILLPVREDAALFPGLGPKGLKRLGEAAQEAFDRVRETDVMEKLFIFVRFQRLFRSPEVALAGRRGAHPAR